MPRTVIQICLGLLARPLRRRRELIFAESVSQAIAIGAPIDRALSLAAETSPSFRFRSIIQAMILNVRSGYTLERSLALTGARVDTGLLESLRVGEELGTLTEELSAYACRISPNPASAVGRLIGRSPATSIFAKALARLLRERRLTLEVIDSAGRLAASEHPVFRSVADDIVQEMKNGRTFAECLESHRETFDPLFRGLVRLAKSRDQMRQCMESMGR